MALHLAVLGLVVDAALGAWLGIMAFFSFVGAPRAFAVFGDDAGAYVTDVFPRYYRIGVGLGVVTTVAALARGTLAGFGAAALSVVLLAGLATLLAAVSLAVLIPRMEASGDAGFDRYHRQSVALNAAALLAVALALVAAHLSG